MSTPNSRIVRFAFQAVLDRDLYQRCFPALSSYLKDTDNELLSNVKKILLSGGISKERAEALLKEIVKTVNGDHSLVGNLVTEYQALDLLNLSGERSNEPRIETLSTETAREESASQRNFNRTTKPNSGFGAIPGC